MKNILIALLFLMPSLCIAQRADSLFIREEGDGRWMARYRVLNERNVFDVAKKFSAPAATIADVNRLSYADKLAVGAVVKIPLTVSNWYNHTPPASSVVLPLYYRTVDGSKKKDLAKHLGIAKSQLDEWNVRLTDDITPGQVLAVGWLNVGGRVGNSSAQNVENVPPPPAVPPTRPDTVVFIEDVKPLPVLSAIEQAFHDQTAGGTMVTTEKGAAAFFPAQGGTIKGVHYAFHNTASRGSVVRVHNPGTARTVYVKVLGPLPKTKQYAGAIIGISAAAKAELGVRGDSRAWCEVSYAGY